MVSAPLVCGSCKRKGEQGKRKGEQGKQGKRKGKQGKRCEVNFPLDHAWKAAAYRDGLLQLDQIYLSIHGC